MPLTGIKQVLSRLNRNLHSRSRELFPGFNTSRFQERHHLSSIHAASGNNFSGDKESDAFRLETREKNKAPPPTGASTLLANIKACIISRDLRRAKEVHLECVRSREDSNRYVANNLINMYVKCGSLAGAQKLFDNLKHRDVVAWNSLMVAYVENGDNKRALEMFSQMIAAEGSWCCPSVRSFVVALQACTNMAAKEDPRLIGEKLVKLRALEMGMYIHSQAVKLLHHGWDIFLSTTLVDMYSKCGSLADACKVFDKMPCHNVVCWTALMIGYSENGEDELALELFWRIQPEGWAPNYRTFIAALKACTGLAQKELWTQVEGRLLKVESLRRGMEIHELAKKRGFDGEMFLASTLVDMYSKCGSTADAREVFDKMQRHDLVSWTGMLLGYSENGQEELALEFFSLIRRENFSPDAVAYVAALKACGGIGALEAGRKLHREIKDLGYDKSDAVVTNSLIHLYGKCASMAEAQQVFDEAATRDLVTWNALMSGYAHQGATEQVFEVFERMKRERVKPDGITFLLMLNACTHAGLVEKGKEVFDLVCSASTPTLEHFTCLIDLLGRASHLEEALRIARSMPCKPDATLWRALLGACHKWKDVRVGELAFEALLELDSGDAAAFVLMGNIYAGAEMWEE